MLSRQKQYMNAFNGGNDNLEIDREDKETSFSRSYTNNTHSTTFHLQKGASDNSTGFSVIRAEQCSKSDPSKLDGFITKIITENEAYKVQNVGENNSGKAGI